MLHDSFYLEKVDDIELVDWTTTNFLFARLWFCEDIHHSSILKLSIEKAIQNSTNANLSSKLFQDGSNYEQKSVSWVCVFTLKGHLVDILPYSQLACLPY